MARKLSPLVASLTLDINKWTAGIKAVQRDQEALSKSLKPVTETAKTMGTALVAAGAAVGGALLAMSKSAANFGDALLDASKRTGVSTEQLAAYKLLADQSGTSFEGLSKGIGLLSKNIVLAGSGSKEQIKIFNALGISIKDASGHIKNADQILPEIAKKFASLEDGTVKTALAMKLFGRAGAELIPLLNEGAEGIDKAQKAAEKYGIAMTRAEAAVGDTFNDTLQESKAALQGFANAIGLALLPKLTELVKSANEWIATVSRWVKAHPELTAAIAKTAAVLFGAGGLLLGIQGLAIAVAKLVPLLSSLRGTMAAISLLKGVKTFQDFSAGITLIGETSIAAKAGLIGLAAAAGYAIGQLINYGIELLGIQKQADEFIANLTRVVTIGTVNVSNSRTSKDIALEKINNDRLEQEAKRRGMSVAQLRAESAKIGMATHKANEAAAAGASKNKAAADMEAELKRIMGALDKTGDSAGKSTSQIQEMMKAFKRENSEATDLNAVLTVLKGTNADGTQVLDTFGSRIEDVAHDFFLTNRELPQTIGYYYALNQHTKALTQANQEWSQGMQETLNHFREETKEIQKFSTEPIEIVRDSDTQKILDAAEAIGKHRIQIKDATDNLKVEEKQLRDTADAMAALVDEGFNATQIEQVFGMSLDAVIERADKLGTELKETSRKTIEFGALQARVNDTLFTEQRHLSKTADEMAVLIRAGYSVAQVAAIMGTSIESVTERSKELGGELNSTSRKALEQAVATQKLKDAWGDTFASISDRLVDWIVDFDFSFKKLKDLGVDTAKELARSFLDGFFKPFKDQLKGLGEEAGKWAAKLAFGTVPDLTGQKAGGQQQQGGLLGSLISGGSGGILGGLFGMGGGRYPMDERIGGYDPRLGGQIEAGGGGFGFSSSQMTGLMGALDPINMGLSVANQAVDLYNKTFGQIGKGRKAANEIVKSQEAFVNETLAKIVDDATLSATNKLKLVNNAWAEFQANLTRFAGNDPNNQKVTNQAFASVSPLLSQIQRDLIVAGANESNTEGGRGNTFTGDIVLNFNMPEDVDSPAEWLDWFNRNVDGIREKITRGVMLTEDAIVNT